MGEPAILDEHGQRCELRGNQAWAVLARILLSKKPMDRRRLSAELFADTADPLGTLRWCLAALRRAFDEPTAFRGDPIQRELPPGVRVDLNAYESGQEIPQEIGDLLDGVEIRGSTSFSTWLLVERQRVAGVVEESLRRSCLTALSRGDVAAALRFAEQGVRRAPFDEAFHVLLVKSFAAAGRMEAALAHVAATEAAFRAELGVAPSPALRSAARRTIMAPEAGVSHISHARSLLEAGKAAISAGAVDAGIETLRRAVHESEEAGSLPLRGEALIELGTALVHAVRGYDDEGAVLLHQAAELANEGGLPVQRAAALRELGYLDALAGRRTSAATYLADASACAEAPGDLAGIHSVIAFNLVDWGRVEEGLAVYDHALELARSAGNRRREAWCLGIGARGWLEADKPDEALLWLDECLRLTEDLRWVAFRPWAVALRAHPRRRPGSSTRKCRD